MRLGGRHVFLGPFASLLAEHGSGPLPLAPTGPSPTFTGGATWRLRLCRRRALTGRIGSPYLDAPNAYAHTFSPEIALVFAFATPVPPALHTAVVRRMLAFPATLSGEPLLRAGVTDLARGGWRGNAAYLLVLPLGRLSAWVAKVRDAGATTQTIDTLAIRHR